MIATFIVLLFLSFFCAPSTRADVTTDDHLIIPDERVGFITQNTTEKNIVDHLQKDHIRRTLHQRGEEDVRCVTELYPGTDQSLFIEWKEDYTYWFAATDETLKQCENISSDEFKTISRIIVQGKKWKISNEKMFDNKNEIEIRFNKTISP